MRCPPSLFALLVLTSPGFVLAQVDAQTLALSRQLGTGETPTQRSQAALTLGGSDDPEALQPLCEGLKDASEQVRAAAARALGQLKEMAGLECLQARKGEPDTAARAAIQSSMKTLQELKARGPKLYVLLGEVKDKTGHLRPEVLKFAEARMRRKLEQMGARLAPARESRAAVQGVLRKHGIHGYQLQAEVHDTESGGLRVTMVCVGYPDQALLGDVELQASGAKPEELLKALAPRIIQEAAATFDWDT